MEPLSRRANSAREEPSSPPAILVPGDEDAVLANSKILSRLEVVMRRKRIITRLEAIYRYYYWIFMEDLPRIHREFYWMYGSPFKEDDEDEERENGVLVENVNVNGDNRNSVGNAGDVNGEGNSEKLGFRCGGRFSYCAVQGCTTKAMPLTKFCHTHILYDSRQKLYKSCKFRYNMWRDGQKTNGPLSPPHCKSNRNDPGLIQCSKPILRTTVPSLCPIHAVRTERSLRQLLRKEGVSASTSAKLSTKFNCVIVEYVRLIQSRRRAAATVQKNPTSDIMMEDSTT